MLIVNGVIHTMDGPVIQRGYVWVEGSRISGVGDMDSLTGEELLGPVVDAQGGHVLPGFLDIHCHVGFAADQLNEGDDPCTPQLRGLDGADPMDEYFAQARGAGVTCVVTGPGSLSPIGGQMVALKTGGIIADQMVVRQPAAMKFALGENPIRGGGPRTRMATAALIREQLARAVQYGRKLEQAEESGGDRPDFDPKLEALVPVVSGRVPAHFHAHRADDMATAVRIAKEFGLDLVLVHGTDGPLIADFLARAGAPVITGPSLTDKSKPELRNLAMENTAALARAGVQVAICTDHPETPIQYLPLCAALAARAGMDEEEALAAITISAACIAGMDDRLGSLTMGKDADIVMMSAHPFDLKSRVQRVWIDGREVTL